MDAPQGRCSNPRAKVVDLMGYRQVRERERLPLFEDTRPAQLQSSVTTSLSERQVAHRARMLEHLTAHR